MLIFMAKRMRSNNAPHRAGEKRRTSANHLPRPRVGANVSAQINGVVG